MDAGGTIGPTNIAEELANHSFNPFTLNLMSTNIAECMKQHINECIEFVADIHTINKVKVVIIMMSCICLCNVIVMS